MYNKYQKLTIYLTPYNITYFWSIKFLLITCSKNIDLAFDSIKLIMRDTKNGWFIRYLHSNGASFLILYLHRDAFIMQDNISLYPIHDAILCNLNDIVKIKKQINNSYNFVYNYMKNYPELQNFYKFFSDNQIYNLNSLDIFTIK